jgi:hypothetical protein
MAGWLNKTLLRSKATGVKGRLTDTSRVGAVQKTIRQI